MHQIKMKKISATYKSTWMNPIIAIVRVSSERSLHVCTFVLYVCTYVRMYVRMFAMEYTRVEWNLFKKDNVYLLLFVTDYRTVARISRKIALRRSHCNCHRDALCDYNTIKFEIRINCF